MKRFSFLILVCVSLLAEIVLCLHLFSRIEERSQDSVMVNECLHSVKENFGMSEKYDDTLVYTILSSDGSVLYQNREGIAESINDAVKNRDTILDIEVEGAVVGKLIIHNTTTEQLRIYKQKIVITILCFSTAQVIILLIYYLYLKKTIIQPFRELNAFAVRVAGGNLDIPLKVDRQHIFGSFTEAFDLMRSELRKSRAAEKKANDDKKEIIAKLSHDIKTPVASIKSTSELGYELASEERLKESFHLINMKSDQITTLVDNLFHASIQEITEISVNPGKQNSSVISDLIRNADYRNKAGDFTMCECDVYIDKVKLQQAFDNVFMNSYKYADTSIEVEITQQEHYLVIRIADFGGGVTAEELPLLKEKYKRGVNAEQKDGAGLGLYLTDYYLTAMDGRLELSGDENGFAAIFYLRTI